MDVLGRLAAFVAVMVLARIAWGVVETGASNYLNKGGPVLVIRASDHLAFTNDSDDVFSRCEVTIEGGYKALVGGLGPRGRSSINRLAFDPNMPSDEFSRRSEVIALTCHNAESRSVAMTLK